MNIIVVGAGEVGYYLSQIFSERGHHVTVIEYLSNVSDDVDDSADVRVIQGNGASAEVLVNAEISECDFFLAMTRDDRTNLLSCSLAKALGAKTIIARMHDQTYSDNSYVNYQLHFGIDYLLNPEALCAVELVKVIRNPGRVAVENFARGQIEVQMVNVSNRSKFINYTLKEMPLDKKIRVGYIQRGDEYEVPTADTVLTEGDKVTLIGPAELLYDIRPNFEPEEHIDSIGITLFGGSEIAIAIVRLLNNPRFKIRIIESDPNICKELAERFPKTTVIHGSATSLRLMEEEHIGDCDYFIACTNKDEDNIMTCLQAAKLGTKHVQLIINKQDYEHIIENMKSTLGVEHAIAPRVVTVNEILRITSQEPYIDLASLPGDKVKIIEVRIPHNSSVVSKSIKDVSWPQSCMIAALLHKFEARVPGPDDIILAGDSLVAIVAKTQISDLLKLLAP